MRIWTSAGLLDETLVVAVAEFGRTPKINPFGGRDHWGHVFSFVLAGAGIRGGQAYGSSDRQGGYPASDRVQPQDLTATIFHLLGIDHRSTFPDRTGRPLPVSEGEPIRGLLGMQPATTERSEPGGDLTLVPPYDEEQIRDVDFESGRPLVPHGTATRQKSWQASPLAESAGASPLRVAVATDAANSRSGKRHASIMLKGGSGQTKIGPGTRAMLSQQVRNPMAGTYTFAVHASGSGSAEFYRETFLEHFACRLVIFAFRDLKKNHAEHEPFVSAEFRPAWSPAGEPNYQRFEVAVTLRSQDGGANQTGRGIGVAVIVEKQTPGELELSPRDEALFALTMWNWCLMPASATTTWWSSTAAGRTWARLHKCTTALLNRRGRRLPGGIRTKVAR